MSCAACSSAEAFLISFDLKEEWGGGGESKV